MNAMLREGNAAQFPANQISLQQAVRTLRAIRERYETGRMVNPPYVRAYTVQVALGHGDMLWLTAAIEALEKAVVTNSS